MPENKSRRRAAGETRVHLVSLGCPKNLVDSEVMLGRLGGSGIVIAQDPHDADIVVVNTCGFVDSAKEESIDAILSACELKEGPGRVSRVVVTGCLGQRYGEQLADEIPSLDAIIGLGETDDLAATLLRLSADASETAEGGEPRVRVSDPTKACHADVGRFRLTPRHYAYLRISEGCDNPCTFCAIPSIRGRFRSKPRSAVLAEARELAESGARELIVISQDTTSYGADSDRDGSLATLLEDLSSVDGVDWIRVLYTYPAFLTDDMIGAIADLPRVVPYVDMPLQHISSRMLRKMGRRLDEGRTRSLLSRMRERIPGLFLRTTFIVGFPGESDEDFATLVDFVEEHEFERMGAFCYSSEEGTPAATFPDPVPEEVAEARLERLMLAQQAIAFRQNRDREGSEVSLLIDEVGAGDGPGARRVARGRTYGEAPDIDPRVVLDLPPDPGGASLDPIAKDLLSRPGFAEIEQPREEAPSVGPGDLIRARIVGSSGYDLLATRIVAE